MAESLFGFCEYRTFSILKHFMWIFGNKMAKYYYRTKKLFKYGAYTVMFRERALLTRYILPVLLINFSFAFK